MVLLTQLPQKEQKITSSVYWRKQWQPTPVFLPGESQGSHRVGHDGSDLAAAAAAALSI